MGPTPPPAPKLDEAAIKKRQDDRRRRNIEVEVEELRASLEEQCYDREAIVEICKAKREKLLRKLEKPNAAQDSDDEGGDEDGGSRKGSPEKEPEKAKEE